MSENLSPDAVLEKESRQDAAVGAFAAYLKENHYQPLAIEERIVLQMFIDWCRRAGYRGWL